MCALRIETDEETKRDGQQEEMKKKSLKKQGYCGYERKMTPDIVETMRENALYPLPPNLTKQDGCWPAAAAATGGAPPHTIIGFHYAAISLK